MKNEALSHYLNEFLGGRELAESDTAPFFDALITSSDEALLANILLAWEKKGSSEDELFNLATLMRSRMRRLEHRHAEVVDVVGTGGSHAKTFNISTAAAFVVAGAGVAVAKHGNRAATSSSGSADVLEQLGVRADSPPEVAERSLNEIGICFMFAPHFHSLSPALARARRAVGRPTIFNNLGPLCNPADAGHQLIGVWDENILHKTARVLSRLGTNRSWVVHAENGLDEIALQGRTFVISVEAGSIRPMDISISDFGTFNGHRPVPTSLDAIESASLIRRILGNKKRGSNAEKLVLMNAAAAMFLSGKAITLPDGFSMATESIASGAALQKLTALAEATQI